MINRYLLKSLKNKDLETVFNVQRVLPRCTRIYKLNVEFKHTAIKAAWFSTS